ncbi:hypothetical protein GCM10009549_45540 [Streptomyces thermoalcalitolerans]|uniref:Uncharacterized protein n=1 Tax=Streptomyces thermoalcalitolerans TaxID=65605 RepID=A0ABN1P930_9ACTN
MGRILVYGTDNRAERLSEGLGPPNLPNAPDAGSLRQTRAKCPVTRDKRRCGGPRGSAATR